MNGNEPATKADLQAVEQRLDQKLQDLEQKLEDFKVEVNTRFQEFEHRMEQQLSEMEGRILTSIYRLAESSQQRITQGEVNQASVNARLATFETRLTEIEKRLNMPPTQ